MTALCEALNTEEKLPYLEGVLVDRQGLLPASLSAKAARGERARFQHAERVFSEECVGVAWELATASHLFALDACLPGQT